MSGNCVQYKGHWYVQARTVNDLTPEYLKTMQPNDWVRVYHATGLLSGDLKPQDMVFGIDALGGSKSNYHPDTPGGHQYKGVYVGPTKRSVGAFGRLVFEFAVKARNLHATDWSANISKKWDKDDSRGAWKGDNLEYLKDKCEEEYPDSFNSMLSGSLDTSAKDACGNLIRGHEPQALFLGIAKAQDILTVHYMDKTYAPQEFIKAFPDDISHSERSLEGPDPKSTTLSLDDYLGIVRSDLGKDPEDFFSTVAMYWALDGRDKALSLLKGLAPFSGAAAERFLTLLANEYCSTLHEVWDRVSSKRPELNIGDPPACQQRSVASTVLFRGATYRKAEASDYLYHVTYVGSLPAIASGGLHPGRGVSFGKGYSGYSAGKLFLTEPEGIGFWIERLGAMAENRADNPVQDGLIPIVVRAPSRIFDELEEDKAGTKDSHSQAWTTAESVQPELLEVWEGSTWAPIKNISAQQLIDEAYEAAEKEYEDDEELVYLNESHFEPFL